MKKIINQWLTRASQVDAESDLAHGLLRFLTYSSLFFFLPAATYWIAFIDINNSITCNNYYTYTLPFSLNETSIIFLSNLLYVFSILSALGILFFISSWIVFLGFSILLLHSFGSCYSNHLFHPLGLLFLLWAVNGTRGKYRLDSFIFTKRFSNNKSYIFKFLKINFCLIFFYTGINKLYFSGTDWFLSDSLKSMMIMQNYFHEGFSSQIKFQSLNRAIVNFSYLPNILAFLTILIEIGTIFALFFKKKDWLFVLPMFIVQVGIRLIMYINFYPWLILYYVWVFSWMDKWFKKSTRQY